MTQWEYKILFSTVIGNDQKQLNEFGLEGWELVATTNSMGGVEGVRDEAPAD
ncbi:hypothetical protein LCGC14_1649230 [marine sediment metagenome]|uniref:DUF4177 domain-containing protein n=1 Tax=marine sediment metagenome TaxID=412755 RepID=A0A0F9IJW6_9ZZZZ